MQTIDGTHAPYDVSASTCNCLPSSLCCRVLYTGTESCRSSSGNCNVICECGTFVQSTSLESHTTHAFVIFGLNYLYGLFNRIVSIEGLGPWRRCSCLFRIDENLRIDCRLGSCGERVWGHCEKSTAADSDLRNRCHSIISIMVEVRLRNCKSVISEMILYSTYIPLSK